MKQGTLSEHIWIAPVRSGGKPRGRGHRIEVSFPLNLLEDGESIEETLTANPGITVQGSQACISYGAEIGRDRHVDMSLVEAA